MSNGPLVRAVSRQGRQARTRLGLSEVKLHWVHHIIVQSEYVNMCNFPPGEAERSEAPTRDECEDGRIWYGGRLHGVGPGISISVLRRPRITDDKI